MKKLLSICIALLIVFSPKSNIFANNKIEKSDGNISIESQMDFIPYQTSSDKLKISVTGGGGTANLDYLSKGKYLSWRLTSSKGTITMMTADVIIRNSKGDRVATYPLMMNGPGITQSGVINVNWLSKGKYTAKMSGVAMTPKGSIVIKDNVEIPFTKR